MAKGIFCLEGDWWGDLKRASSVRPILDLLKQWDPYFIPYIYRDVGTVESLRYYLRKWTLKAHRGYPILYLAFHGDPGALYVGDRRSPQSTVTLDLLEEMLTDRCKGRIIFFAACGMMRASRNRLNRFLRATGALAVCGYTADVDWLRATAFELLVLSAMQDNALTVSGARAMQARIRREASVLARELNFRMTVRKPTRS